MLNKLRALQQEDLFLLDSLRASGISGAGAFDVAGAAAAAQAASQPLAAALTALAAIMSATATASAQRAALGLVIGTDVAAQSSVTTIIANVQSGTTYTFALTDAGKVVEGTNAGATIYTIDTNTNVAFPVGTVIEVFQDSAGQITIAAAGGVTLKSDGNKVKTTGQNATIGLRKQATNVWILSGDLA